MQIFGVYVCVCVYVYVCVCVCVCVCMRAHEQVSVGMYSESHAASMLIAKAL